MKRNIPIQIIYIMLCYAWNILTPKQQEFFDAENFKNTHNFLAKILIKGCFQLLKKGLMQEYVNINNENRVIKGKISISNTIKKSLLIKGLVDCNYDEFLVDTEYNKIIKTTILNLIRNKNLSPILIKDLKTLLLYFNRVSTIKLSSSLFRKLEYSRNNVYYRQILSICELIFHELIVNERKGNIEFITFLKDEKMAKLYEKFVLNFYKKELDKNAYSVSSPHIEWLLSDKNETVSNILPQMRTDVVIKNKLNNKQLVIDTKFYSDVLISSHCSDSKKIRNAHLYQINTYLDNIGISTEKIGLLLYPQMDTVINEEIALKDKTIKVKTINLDCEWNRIKQDLINIVDF